MQRSYFMKTKAHSNASLTYFAITCSAQGNELSCQGLALFSIINRLSLIHFSDSDSSKHFAHSYLTSPTDITALCPFRFHITPGTRCSQSQLSRLQNQEREDWYLTEKHRSRMLACTTNNFIYHTYLYLNRQFRNKLICGALTGPKFCTYLWSSPSQSVSSVRDTTLHFNLELAGGCLWLLSAISVVVRKSRPRWRECLGTWGISDSISSLLANALPSR